MTIILQTHNIIISIRTMAKDTKSVSIFVCVNYDVSNTLIRYRYIGSQVGTLRNV